MSKRCNKNETGISEQSVKLVEEQYENTYVYCQKEVSQSWENHFSIRKVAQTNVWTFSII